MLFRDLFPDQGALDDFLLMRFGFEPVFLPGIAGRFQDPEPARELKMAQEVERELEGSVEVHRAERLNGPRRDVLVLHTGGPEVLCTIRKEDVVVWTGHLRDGDALISPFGHEIETGGTKLLWFEVTRPSAMDLFVWVARSARHVGAFLEPAPFFSPPEVQAEYLGRVREHARRVFDAPNLLEVFRRRMNGQAPGRRDGALQRGPVSESPDSAMLELTAPRRLSIAVMGDEVGVHSGGKHLKLGIGALAVLRFLESRTPVAMGELRREFANADLAPILDALGEHGVIGIRGPEGGV